MKRRSFGFLVWLVMVLVAASVQAAPKKKGHGKNKKKDKAANSEAIVGAMGDLKWGMSRDELTKYLANDIKERYRPLVQKTRDPIEKDRLRNEFKAEIKKLQDSYVEFDGRATGWDVSFLRGEFTQNNDEAMIVMRDKNSQNFYFLIDGHLWKWYKAFDAAVFPVKGFGQFSATVQRKFGEGQEAKGDLGDGERHWIEWQDPNTRMRAVDETSFYGFYSLVFEEKSTLAQLATLRRNKSDTGRKHHAVVDAIAMDDEVEADDDRPNIVDRITGKMRVREQGGRESSPSRSAKSSGKRNSKSDSSESSGSSGRSVSVENDPLEGIL